jgi:hypothetical protein
MHSIFEILDEATDSAGPDLVSLADLKFALGITGSADDAALQGAITFQSRLIAEYCDRRFGRAECLETFTFDRSDLMLPRQALTLRLYPVAEVHEVSSVGATEAGYELDPETGRLWMPDGAWTAAVAITYSGGYDLPEEAPARLAKAVIEAIFETRAMGGRDPSIRSVAHGDTNISYFTSATATANSGFLSAPVLDLIRPYRRLHAA